MTVYNRPIPEFTWRCDVCGQEKPDDKISVKHVPIAGLERSFPDARFNMKYCNDSTDCIYTASNTKVKDVKP